MVDWLKGKGFEFDDVGFNEAKALGLNLVSLGYKKDLSMAGSVKSNKKTARLGLLSLRSGYVDDYLGRQVVHCLRQSLRREWV